MNALTLTEAPRPDASPATASRALGLILVAGLAVRLGLWLWFAPLAPHIVDEQEYNRLAHNLLAHGEFAYEPGRPTSLRPPLYPLLVAGVYAVAGVDNFQAVRLVQVLLSLATVWLVYRLGREAFSERVGLWAATLIAFYPTLLGMNNLILTETLFTLLLTAACYAVVRYYRQEKVGYLALAGLLLGLAALTRSIVWLSPPLLAGYVLLTARCSLARRALGAGVMVLAFAATVAPWSVRNTLLQGTFVTIDTMGGRNFLMGNYAYTPLYRSWDAISLEEDKAWYHEVMDRYPQELRTTQGKIDKLALKEGLAYVREHPGQTALRDVIKFFDFWGLERELIAGLPRGYFGHVPSPAALVLGVVILVSYPAALFLGIFGVLFRPAADRRLHWLLLAVIAFVCALHTLVFGHSRYHLPLVPLLLLYAAAVCVDWGSVWQQRRTGLFRLAGALCLLFVAGWCWNFVAGDWEQLRGVLGL